MWSNYERRKPGVIRLRSTGNAVTPRRCGAARLCSHTTPVVKQRVGVLVCVCVCVYKSCVCSAMKTRKQRQSELDYRGWQCQCVCVTSENEGFAAVVEPCHLGNSISGICQVKFVDDIDVIVFIWTQGWGREMKVKEEVCEMTFFKPAGECIKPNKWCFFFSSFFSLSLFFCMQPFLNSGLGKVMQF